MTDEEIAAMFEGAGDAPLDTELDTASVAAPAKEVDSDMTALFANVISEKPPKASWDEMNLKDKANYAGNSPDDAAKNEFITAMFPRTAESIYDGTYEDSWIPSSETALDVASLPGRSVGALMDVILNGGSSVDQLAESLSATGGGDVDGKERSTVGSIAQEILRDPLNAAFPMLKALGGIKDIGVASNAVKNINKAKHLKKAKNLAAAYPKLAKVGGSIMEGAAEELSREGMDAATGGEFDAENIGYGALTSGVLSTAGQGLKAKSKDLFKKGVKPSVDKMRPNMSPKVSDELIGDIYNDLAPFNDYGLPNQLVEYDADALLGKLSKSKDKLGPIDTEAYGKLNELGDLVGSNSKMTAIDIDDSFNAAKDKLGEDLSLGLLTPSDYTKQLKELGEARVDRLLKVGSEVPEDNLLVMANRKRSLDALEDATEAEKTASRILGGAMYSKAKNILEEAPKLRGRTEEMASNVVDDVFGLDVGGLDIMDNLDGLPSSMKAKLKKAGKKADKGKKATIKKVNKQFSDVADEADAVPLMYADAVSKNADVQRILDKEAVLKDMDFGKNSGSSDLMLSILKQVKPTEGLRLRQAESLVGSDLMDKLLKSQYRYEE